MSARLLIPIFKDPYNLKGYEGDGLPLHRLQILPVGSTDDYNYERWAVELVKDEGNELCDRIILVKYPITFSKEILK